MLCHGALRLLGSGRSAPTGLAGSGDLEEGRKAGREEKRRKEIGTSRKEAREEGHQGRKEGRKEG